MRRMAQMEARTQALRNENLSLQQQQQTTAATSPVQNLHMVRLLGVLADQVRVLSERPRVTLVYVKGVGKPRVVQNDVSGFYAWAKKIEDYVIGIEPQLEGMLDRALDSETAIRQTMIASKFGENGAPTGQVGHAQMVVQLNTALLAHLTSYRADLWTKRSCSMERVTQSF